MPDLEREYVFISYAHENLTQVLKVYKGLKKRKVNVWIDKKNLGPGRWKPQILKAISRSKYFVICLSNAALKKISGEEPGFQDEELQIAWEYAREQDERGFTIIPVKLENCALCDMRLSGWQQYDLFEDWEGVLDTLAVNLGGNSLSDAMAKDERTEDEKVIAGMMGKGFKFILSGEYEKELSISQAAINKTDNLKALWAKGNVLLFLKRYKKAIEAYDKVLLINPKYRVALTNKGSALCRAGQHEDAIDAFDKAIAINSDDQVAWFNKGVALSMTGRHENAIEAFDKVIAINYNDYEAWYKKGREFLELDQLEEALKAYKKVLEFKQDHHNACYDLACVYSLKKEKGNALKYFQKATENGFNDLEHIKKDTDLDFIRNEKKFQEIISKLTMKYLITKLFSDYKDKIIISKNEFIDLKKAQNVLAAGLAIEEDYEVLLANYEDFEKEILNATTEFMLKKPSAYKDTRSYKARLNRRLVNILTSSRLYLDHMEQHVKHIVSKSSDGIDKVESIRSDFYDKYVEYEFMEALRNYVQHCGFPVHEISLGINRDTDSLKRIAFRIDFTAKKQKLQEDKGFKKSALKKLDEKVDIKQFTRKYVECLSEIHGHVRNIVSEDLSDARLLFENYINRFRRDVKANTSGLAAIAFDDKGDKKEEVHLLLDWDELRCNLKNRNEVLKNLSLRYVTGEIKNT